MPQAQASPVPPSTAQADLDLIAVDHVLAGDVDAFESIVLRWQAPIINMAWRYTRDRSRAEELAQEAFIRAWRALPTWRRESTFSTWLFSLAANHFRNHLKLHPVQTLTLEEAPEPSAAPTAHLLLEDAQRSRQIRRAVLTLPHLYRESVLLFYFHEMDIALTARTLKIPEGTVKARLARGRDLLRRRFPSLGLVNPSTAASPAQQLEPYTGELQ